MNVGFMGLGKLGLPCALAMEHYGTHKIFGFDVNPGVLENIKARRIPYTEAGAQDLLDRSQITLCDVQALVRSSDIVFIAVQTPHAPEFEGVTPLPSERADFDYSFLLDAIETVCRATFERQTPLPVAIISTVLPGTIEREIIPRLNPGIELYYNPFFIAMGTAIEDFMNPEFVLLGSPEGCDGARLKELYASLHNHEVLHVSISSAELIKVAYNTFIGLKIAFVNTLMEVADASGANVDDVTVALGKATKRLISTRYMRAGMGDGGGCHPRDNIAMSHFARRLGLSYDLFESIMLARERQAEWLARMAIQASTEHSLPIVILGKAFKPETNLTVGSPARLLADLLDRAGVHFQAYDPVMDGPPISEFGQSIFVIATAHETFREWHFPQGSVVIDPWAMVETDGNFSLRQPGRKFPRRLYE